MCAAPGGFHDDEPHAAVVIPAELTRPSNRALRREAEPPEVAAAMARMPDGVRRYVERMADVGKSAIRCECGKAKHPDEAAALVALAGRGDAIGQNGRVYKCPGTRFWHLTSHSGFHPRALKTRARILAWHIDVRRTVNVATVASVEFGIDWDDERGPAKRLRQHVQAMVDAGLVTRCEHRTDGFYVTAADRAGLLRVCQIGLREYLLERYSVGCVDADEARAGVGA